MRTQTLDQLKVTTPARARSRRLVVERQVLRRPAPYGHLRRDAASLRRMARDESRPPCIGAPSVPLNTAPVLAGDIERSTAGAGAGASATSASGRRRRRRGVGAHQVATAAGTAVQLRLSTCGRRSGRRGLASRCRAPNGVERATSRASRLGARRRLLVAESGDPDPARSKLNGAAVPGRDAARRRHSAVAVQTNESAAEVVKLSRPR